MTTSISVFSRSEEPTKVGTPPYSMYAFEPGGVPRVQEIGSNPASLSWTVDHLPGRSCALTKRGMWLIRELTLGTKLLLVVLNSQNNTGGIPRQMYEVVGKFQYKFV